VVRQTGEAGLCLAQARWVDEQVAPWLGSLPFGQVLDLLAAKIIAADPDAAEARRVAAALERFVRTGRSSEHGLKTHYARATAGEIIYLTAMIDRIAGILAQRGDTDAVDVRRSKALAILGNPAHALTLLQQAATSATERSKAAGAAAAAEDADPLDTVENGDTDDDRPVVREGDLHPADNDADDPTPQRHRCPACDGQGSVVGDPAGFVKPPTAAQLGRVWPKATLYVHISAEAFYTGRLGVARLEGVGPVTTAQAVDFLGHSRVVVKPVIDLTVQRSVNAYETPGWMREMVHLLRPVEVFPYGTNTTRHVDLDHPVPYVPLARGGPAGQTDSHQLGPLSRRAHRIRTHGQWQLHQPRPGVWDWRSPHGHWWRVDHTGTHYHGTDPPTDHAA
jgi:hypothetical protein